MFLIEMKRCLEFLTTLNKNSCLRCKIAWKRRSRLIFVRGYFNLRGWQQLDPYVENFVGGADACCRLMVGMHKNPREQLQEILSLSESIDEMDVQTSIRLKKRVAQEFRDQLVCGEPTNEDEVGRQCGLQRNM